jgi:hypothetical protein
MNLADILNIPGQASQDPTPANLGLLEIPKSPTSRTPEGTIPILSKRNSARRSALVVIASDYPEECESESEILISPKLLSKGFFMGLAETQDSDLEQKKFQRMGEVNAQA